MMQVDVDGVKIAYDVQGSGSTVVLLHGYPLSRTMWDAQTDALAKHVRVVRIDLRGMGESPYVPGPYMMETLAADVAAVLDSIGVECVSLVGHSMGGYVAMAFARMYTERVERIALVCSRLDADAPERIDQREHMADALEHGDCTSLSINKHAYSAQTVAMLEKLERENDPRSLAHMQRGIALRVESTDIASELKIPVLIIAGRLDTVVRPEIASAMPLAFPRARLAWAELSGHFAPIEEPELVTELLLEWLDGA